METKKTLTYEELMALFAEIGRKIEKSREEHDRKMEQSREEHDKEMAEKVYLWEMRNDGVNCLLEKLGALETEAFISNILKEPFDYTKWSKDLYCGLSLHELNSMAAEFVKNNYEPPQKVITAENEL